MNQRIATFIVLGNLVFFAGCETTNSIPYKASTTNILAIQNSLKAQGKKVSVGTIAVAPGMDESLTCRLMGPVKVAPGKTLPQYIKEAFMEELFAAQVYDTSAPSIIDGSIEELKFSSVSPASWDIRMKVKSNRSPGYTVSVSYRFETSFSAFSACKNVADAFGPAVQELLNRVVTNPEFPTLIQ